MRRRVLAIDMMEDNLAFIRESLRQRSLSGFVELINNGLRLGQFNSHSTHSSSSYSDKHGEILYPMYDENYNNTNPGSKGRDQLKI